MCAMSKKVLVIKDETHCAISSHSHKKSKSFWDLDFFIQADRLDISSARWGCISLPHLCGVYHHA